MTLSDDQRSMIATAFVAGRSDKQHSLCCAPDAKEACAAIVGRKHAAALYRYAHDSLGCSRWRDPEYDEEDEQHNLDKIADLDCL